MPDRQPLHERRERRPLRQRPPKLHQQAQSSPDRAPAVCGASSPRSPCPAAPPAAPPAPPHSGPAQGPAPAPPPPAPPATPHRPRRPPAPSPTPRTPPGPASPPRATPRPSPAPRSAAPSAGTSRPAPPRSPPRRARPPRPAPPATAPTPHQTLTSPNSPHPAPEPPLHGRSTTRPPGVSKTNPPSSQPTQRCRTRSSTPIPPSRPIHARSKGEAFIATGNTRPDDPVNTSCPSPRAHACTSAGPNARRIGPNGPAASA